jgi:hypothetical protein
MTNGLAILGGYAMLIGLLAVLLGFLLRRGREDERKAHRASTTE